MRRVLNIEAQMAKLFVYLARRRPAKHVSLKQQLATNRGKALGLPKKRPSTRYQEKIAANRNRRWWMKNPTPF